MDGYLIGVLIGFPSMLAGFLLMNRNGTLQKAAVILLSVVPGGSVCCAVALRTVTLPMTTGSNDFGFAFILAANLIVLAGTAYWSGVWKNRLNAGLLVIQAAMFFWIGFYGRGTSLSGVFLLDHLSLVMLLLVNGTGACALIFSLKYMEGHERRRNIDKKRSSLFFAAAGFMLAAMNGLLLTNHLLGLLFCWQVLVLTGFILISHDRTKIALKNGRGFVGLHLFGGIGLLAGAIGLQSLSQTLTISELLMFGDATLILLPVACLVLACLVLAAQFPFQTGLLHTVAAPAPAGVLLQSVTLVNAAIYLIIRISPLFMNTWLARVIAVIGLFSFAAAALLAFMQHDVKRNFAFSTISCAGLAIALTSLTNLQAIYAAVLLAVLHGVTKSLLLFSTSGNANSRLSMRLTLLAGLTMVMPPFGIPLLQWTALEAVASNPVALPLLIGGIVFSVLYWTGFIAKRLTPTEKIDTARLEPMYVVPQIGMTVAVVLLGLFSVPFTNWLITPILRENFSRFADIAQADASSFLIRGWVGINPLLVFSVLAAIVLSGWLILHWICLRHPAKLVEKNDGKIVETDAVDRSECEVLATEATVATAETASEEEPVEVFKTDDVFVVHFPTRSVLALLPEAPKTQIYLTVIACALIILMFEVVIR